MNLRVIRTLIVALAALTSVSVMATELKVLQLKYDMEVVSVGYHIEHRAGSFDIFVETFDRDLANQLCGANPQGCGPFSTAGHEFHDVALDGLTYDSAAENVYFTGAHGKILCATVTHRHSFLGSYDIFTDTGACKFITRHDVGVFFDVAE